MKIKSVKINNFLSVEDAYVEFDNAGLMLVQGWNYDVGRSNGAGKTTIFNAISFGLYDKLPRKVTATEILRRGSKSGFVEVVVELGGDSFTVRRSRPKGVGFKKGGDVLDVTQQAWENILGLNYNQFVLSMYAAQGNSTRFLSINDADKKQFLLQLLNLEEFSSCRIIADGKVKTLDVELTSLRSKKHGFDSKIDAYQESLVDETVILYAVNKCNEAIADMNRQLLAELDVAKPDLSKYSKLEEDILSKKEEFTKARAQREMLHASFKRFDSKLRAVHTYKERCESCGHVLDTSDAKAAHERELEQLRIERDSIKSDIDALDDVISGENGVNEVSRKLRERKNKESAAYDSARLHSNELKTSIALRQQELQQLNLKLQNNSDLLSKIKDLVDGRDKLAHQEGLILRDIELYKTISSIYSSTGAQAYILDSVIDSFNERVCEYVGFLWTNMTYELKSYKENVKGDVTAKFSEHLVMDGKPISIGSLSGGEFRALSLCVDFALIDVMGRQFGFSLSPIVLDEPFDGLDGTGREFIIELLEKFAVDRQVVIVDHASEVTTSFVNVLTVEKRDGISTVCRTT